MRSKTRETVDRDVWGPSPLRLPPPKNIKVTIRWSRELGIRSRAANEAYELLTDLLGKDRVPPDKKHFIVGSHELARARRRERDRNWRRAKRRAAGMVTRDIYERGSITKREPWKAFGCSRRTWERHGKPDVASVSSLMLARDDTLATCRAKKYAATLRPPAAGRNGTVFFGSGQGTA
jgi:hypothetical protein